MNRNATHVSNGWVTTLVLMVAMATVGNLLPLSQAYAASKIAIVVNNQPITSNDIKRRSALFRLRRERGNIKQKATQELIDEALKMQEARRIGVVASKREIDSAYAGFAKNNKMPLRALSQVLNRSGVTVKEFKRFIGAQISWQRAVGARAQASGAAGASPTNFGQSWLAPAGQKVSDAKEYTLQQVVFTIPTAQRKNILNRRKLEANRFRSQFQGCDSSIGLAKTLKNVAVLDRGRTLGHQLPPRWRKTVETTPVGKITPPKVTEKGVEMLAVCKTRNVRAASTGGENFLANPESRKAISKVEKDYIAALKKRSVIKRR